MPRPNISLKRDRISPPITKTEGKQAMIEEAMSKLKSKLRPKLGSKRKPRPKRK